MVFGGILSRRGFGPDDADVAQHGIGPIDLVIVDLYPFEETLASGADEGEIIEKIDIGGIALIRAAAKNFTDVVCIPSRGQYADLVDALGDGMSTDLDFRRRMAGAAFGVSSGYDAAIGVGPRGWPTRSAVPARDGLQPAPLRREPPPARRLLR